MKTKYFNWKQALAVCNDYQFLVSHLLDKTDNPAQVITEVIIGPHSPILQWKYLCSLKSGMTQEEALLINKSKRYNILLLPDQPANIKKVGIKVRVLYNYLKENDLDFDFSKYQDLK